MKLRSLLGPGASFKRSWFWDKPNVGSTPTSYSWLVFTTLKLDFEVEDQLQPFWPIPNLDPRIYEFEVEIKVTDMRILGMWRRVLGELRISINLADTSYHLKLKEISTSTSSRNFQRRSWWSWIFSRIRKFFDYSMKFLNLVTIIILVSNIQVFLKSSFAFISRSASGYVPLICLMGRTSFADWSMDWSERYLWDYERDMYFIKTRFRRINLFHSSFGSPSRLKLELKLGWGERSSMNWELNIIGNPWIWTSM